MLSDCSPYMGVLYLHRPDYMRRQSGQWNNNHTLVMHTPRDEMLVLHETPRVGLILMPRLILNRTNAILFFLLSKEGDPAEAGRSIRSKTKLETSTTDRQKVRSEYREPDPIPPRRHA